MATPYTIIIGNQDDSHARTIANVLERRKRAVKFFDSSYFPMQLGISWDPQRGEGSLVIDKETISFEQICSVYWRQLTPLKEQQSIAMQDTVSALKTFFNEPTINWVNAYATIEAHKIKPRQLHLAKRLGALIPKTYVGNCPEEADRFLKRFTDVVFKPVHGGALTERVKPGKRSIDYLKHVLSISPVTLQQYIPGTNIRTYVIGDETFNIEVESEHLDFRDDDFAKAGAVCVPNTIKNLAKRIMRQMGMQWTAIDWRCDPEGRYFFLEANPSPMFLRAEQETGFQLTESLAELLLEPFSECYSPV